MIVAHFAKVSVLYPRVVISSPVGDKRNHFFPFLHFRWCMTQRSLYAVTNVYYGSCMPGLAKLVRGTIAMLRFLGVVHGTTAPLAPCEPRWITTPISHSSEQGTLSTSSLISKQAVLYWTHGGTYCPEVSTPKTWSLADSSMTNHKPWRSQPSSPFQTLLKPQYQTSPWSSLIMMDGRQTLSTLNTSQTQHHKDEKMCMMTQDIRAKQYYQP
jgi:hypothetical protein